MAWSVSGSIEDALWQAAARRLPGGILSGAALTSAVVDRSRRYTSDRLAAPANPAADLTARALFFTIVDAAKVQVPLAELAGRGLDPRRDPVRILDLGAGCGAMLLGALGHFGAAGVRRVTATLVDRDRDALAIAADAAGAVATSIGIDLAVDLVAADVTRHTPRAPVDLVLAGSVLNELPAPARLPLVTRALASLDPGGAMIVIEPALRATARDLHVVRDQVIEGRLGHVFAPCTRRLAPCPMLAEERDWCHEERPALLPPRTARLAHATGLRDGAMKFAYLVLRRSDEPLVADAGALRVVSQPMKSKGKLEIYGCGDGGRIRLRLLHRARSAENRPVERAVRGDVLVIEPPQSAPVTTVDRGPTTADRGPRTADRGPRTDDRGPRTDDRGPQPPTVSAPSAPSSPSSPSSSPSSPSSPSSSPSSPSSPSSAPHTIHDLTPSTHVHLLTPATPE